MQTIQIVMEKGLLQQANRVSWCRKVNRSALIREALRQYLKQLEVRDKQRRDRDGYRGLAQSQDGLGAWDEVATWPEDQNAARCGFTALRRPTSSGRSLC